MVRCPECKGTQERYAKASMPGVFRVDVIMSCCFCRGEGEVSAEAAQRWREGRERRGRLDAGPTLEEEGRQFGIPMIDQYDIGCGRTPTKR